MLSSQKNRIAFVVFGIVAVLLVNLWVSSSANFLPSSTDTARIIIGAKEIRETGFIQPNIYENGGYSPYKEITNYLYPPFQVLIYTLSDFSGVSFHFVFCGVVFLLSILIFFTLYLLLKEAFKKISLSIIYCSTFFLFFSLTLARSLLLTPQNLFGYLFILVTLYFAFRFFHEKKLKFLFFSLLAFIATLQYHHLSFFVAFMALILFLIIYLKSAKKILVIAGSVLSFGGAIIYLRFVLKQTYLFDDLINSLSQQYRPNANSFFDLPAQIGFLLFLLGFCGLFLLNRGNSLFLKKIVVAMLVVVSLLSYAHYFGIYYFPDRFVAFYWLPLIFLVPLGLNYFFSILKKPLFLIFVTILFTAGCFNFWGFLKSDFDLFSKKFLPKKGDLEAVNFLNTNGLSNSNLLSTYYGENRFSIFLPYFYNNGQVTFSVEDNYPILAARKVKSLRPGFYQKLIKNLGQEKIISQSELESLPEYQVFLMLNFPDLEKSKTFFKEYKIRYFYTWKGSAEDRIFSESENFSVFFENERVKIFVNEKANF